QILPVASIKEGGVNCLAIAQRHNAQCPPLPVAGVGHLPPMTNAAIGLDRPAQRCCQNSTKLLGRQIGPLPQHLLHKVPRGIHSAAVPRPAPSPATPPCTAASGRA